jgi:hypothetical protein
MPRSASLAWCGAALAFVAVLAVLAWQVGAGLDPAIGAGTPAEPAKPRPVVVKRIVRRVIITHRAPAVASGGGGGAPVLASTGGGSAPAPATAAPAPAAAAPAPVAAAPAPATTRSS